MVVQAGMIQNLEYGVNRTRFRIVGAINQPLQASVDQRTGTHRAGLNRGKQHAVLQTMITNRGSSFSQGNDLGMCGWIAITQIPVPASTHDVAMANHHGTDRHLAHLQTSLCSTEGLLHPELV